MSIIDFGEMEKPLREVEKTIGRYNLEEQRLIIRTIQQRLDKAKRDFEAKELSSGLVSGVMKGFFKK